MTQDASGNLYVAEATNRIAITSTDSHIRSPATSPIARFRPAASGYSTRDLSAGHSVGNKELQRTAESVAAAQGLADTQVLLNDQPVPLYFVSPGQINFLVPMSAPESGRAEVQVLRPSTGEILAASSVELARVSPALFIQGRRARQGQIAALNQDNSVNSAANPATKGQIIQLFGAGQGFVPNAPADGAVPTGELRTDEKPRGTDWHGFRADSAIQYSGLAPGLVGVWQINVRIPENVAGGVGSGACGRAVQSVPTNVGFGGKRLRTTIAVRP